MILAALSDRTPAWLRAHPDLGAIGLLLAVSLTTRVRHLTRPLFGDEMITFSNMVLGRGFREIVFGPFDSNSHLLNSLIMKAVYLVAGESPALMRLPNLVFVLLAVALLYLMGAKVLGRTAGFAAALLFSLHPAAVLYSVAGRGYAGMILFTLLSSVLFLQVVRSFSWGRLAGSAAAGFLAGAFHLFAANALVAQALLAVAVAVRPDTDQMDRRAARAAHMGRAILGPLAALAALLALFLPIVRVGSKESFHYSFQTAFPVALANFMGGNAYRTDVDPFSLLILALGLVGFVSLAGDRTLRTYLGLLLLAPAALYGLSRFAPVFTLHPRFFVFLLPFACLLVAAGLQRIAEVARAGIRGGKGAVAIIRGAVALCVLLLAVTFVVRTDVPRGKAFVRAQRVVGDFLDSHPDAHLLTNDTGFVRVRLRQERNMDRVRLAQGIKPIRAFQAAEPTGAIYFIYVPQKRYSASDLIHYQRKVPVELLYRRDDSLRTYLTRNARLEVDLSPLVQVYAIRPEM